MIGDHDLFVQLCDSRGISPPKEILEAIKSGSPTGELRLPCMSIVVPICGVLARVLSSSSTIRVVDLSDCMLLSKGLDSILDALCEGSSVTSLNLKGNNINGPAVAQLGKIFLHNNTIKSLSIEWNSLGSDIDAFGKFCEGLGMNHNIEALDLRYNQISPHCAESLAKALRTNKSLNTVDLAWNTLGLQGGQMLLDGIRDNRSITKLNLRGNCIPDEIVQSIDECLHRNKCRRLVSRASISNTVYAAKSATDDEISPHRAVSKFTNVENSLTIETLKTTLDRPPSNNQRADGAEAERSVLTPNVVGNCCGDVGKSGKIDKVTDVKRTIDELNGMLHDRTTAIDALTKEIGVRDEEIKAYKSTVDRLENEIRRLTEERGNVADEQTREIDELRESRRKAEINWQRELKRLEESLKESSAREKDLETRVQRYERELRKSAVETVALKEKSLLQTQSCEDLIAKSRVEVHRIRREAKERENRYKIELNVLKSTLKESTEALEECQAQLQKSRVELRESSDNFSSLKTRMNEIERVNCRLVRIEESFQKVKDDKKLLEEKSLDSERTIAMLQRQVATLQGELIEPQRRYGLVKDELEQEREKSARLKHELTEERARLQEQNSQIQTLNAQITSLNNQINEIQNNHAEALRERDKERRALKEIISNKERDFNELKTEEVQRASQLYAAFSKYLGSIGPNTTL